MKKRNCPDCGKTHYDERRNVCSKCRHEREKRKDPVKYVFDTLRRNAKRRGHSFSLTLDEFRKFCIKTEYLNGRGRTRNSYTIDRIDSSKGYHIDNIQVLTNSENGKKRWIEFRGYNPDGSRSFAYANPKTYESSEVAPF